MKFIIFGGNLIELEIFRGGCIMCMDYGLMAQIPHYFILAKHINKLAWILKFKLEELEYRGFEPADGYIFGFSLGGRIAIEAGRTFGHQRLGEIDSKLIHDYQRLQKY